MEGKKLSEYTWIFPIDGHELWSPRYIILDGVRHTYCPNCECRFEFPEGIEKIKLGACPKCKTVLFYYPRDNCWHYLPDDFEYDDSICPECNKVNCPEKPDLDDYYYCPDCNIEFNWQIGPLENGLICTKYPYKDGKRLMNKQEMNSKYKKPDPFGVLTSKADGERKAHILAAMHDWVTEKRGGKLFKRALDIGCGEGWITKDIPAEEIVGFDISDLALSRCPEGIITVDEMSKIEGKFDCILAAGVLVREYDFVQFLGLINTLATDFVLTCQTDFTEVSEVATIKGEPIHSDSFPYGKHKQTLRVFSFADVEQSVSVPPPVGATSDNPDGPEPGAELTGSQGSEVPLAENETSGDETGQDVTFKEMIDAEIDALPEGHDLDHLILSTDMWVQLMGNDEPAETYRGFKLEINDEPSTGHEFYHRPESADKDLQTDEGDDEGEKFPDNDKSDGVSGSVTEPRPE